MRLRLRAEARLPHRRARSRLRKLAAALCFPKGSFDLRSNAGGIAVSGEITLHHEQVYIPVSQPATGADSGILIRRCQGRCDYTGGRNHFAPLCLLDHVAEFTARTALAHHLGRGQAIDAAMLRAAMEEAFGASDAAGAWTWKQTYDACEAAQILFLRKFGPAMRARAGTAAATLAMLAKIAALLPTHTRRSEESQALQQFSTPIELGFVASVAAATTRNDLVLEPSAGTGLLAVFAELAGAGVVLNEIAETRAALLGRLFPQVHVTRHNAEQIDDHLEPVVRPTVILMNPPFSASPAVEGRFLAATWKHVSSAFARLAPGGRLVAITSQSFSPEDPEWRAAFVRIQERGGRVVFSAGIDRRAFADHGTQIGTRLTVIDKVDPPRPDILIEPVGLDVGVPDLLALVEQHVPARPLPRVTASPRPLTAQPAPRAKLGPGSRSVVVRTMSGSRNAVPTRVLSGLAPLALANKGSGRYRAASHRGADEDAVLGLWIGSCDGATGAHRPGLSPVPLPGLWQAVQ